MKGSLGFTDDVLGLGAGIFFIGYLLLEIPAAFWLCLLDLSTPVNHSSFAIAFQAAAMGRQSALMVKGLSLTLSPQ
jgi:hypothetical protein